MTPTLEFQPSYNVSKKTNQKTRINEKKNHNYAFKKI